jgi:hypothetical protein
MFVHEVLRLRSFHSQPSAHWAPLSGFLSYQKARTASVTLLTWDLRSVVVLFSESPVLQHGDVSTRPGLTETARKRCSEFAPSR